jgi:hypothetical protein
MLVQVWLITKGFGTNQIEQELAVCFKFKIGRMDQILQEEFGFEKLLIVLK